MAARRRPAAVTAARLGLRTTLVEEMALVDGLPLVRGLPLAARVPRGIDDLLAVGRCIAADADAFASVRVIGPCRLEGQAAAVAARQLVDRDLPARAAHPESLRTGLARLGVPL